jgi:hypothetical protein
MLTAFPRGELRGILVERRKMYGSCRGTSAVDEGRTA